MVVAGADDPLLGGTTCGSLLHQLQLIWDEVGESDEERDKMLLQLEQECLDVYKRKVDQAAKSRALLLQALANSKAEYVRLLSALGEKSFADIPDNSSSTIKEQLAAIAPTLDQLREKKESRIREFADVQLQIETIRREIAGTLNAGDRSAASEVNEADLSLGKLNELHSQLQQLQSEKNDRLRKVLDFVGAMHDLCTVLGTDFLYTVSKVHPSLSDTDDVHSKSISNETLSKISQMVISLMEEKTNRLQKLQELVTQLYDLWNLMDTNEDERQRFGHITSLSSATVEDVTAPGALALEVLEQLEVEVERLDQLKASQMKEITFKKQAVLEDIYAQAHVEINTTATRDRILAIIDSGNFEPSELLEDMDNQILQAKEEAHGRKEILEKVDKWMAACEEESWLDDYNRDDNRYSASRGAHLNLKRAEKARVLVTKIPALVESLVAKTRSWEEDNGKQFTYDGVSLLAMLDEYKMLRQDREEEKRRLRDQKKHDEQLNTEREALFGSKPSPARPLGPKKVVGPKGNEGGAPGTTASRRLSLSVHQSGNRSASRNGRREPCRPVAPVNYVAIAKEDVASQVSSNTLAPSSP